MGTRTKSSYAVLSSAMLALTLLGCWSSRISSFSSAAYEKAVTLKVESLALMEKANTPYETHQVEVDALLQSVEKAFEYAKGRPKNELSIRQWQIMRDPNRNLLGGFLRRWQDESTLSTAFVSEAKQIVSDAFDSIIGLESGKIKTDNIKNRHYVRHWRIYGYI